jgi:hypothetical protein
VDRLLIARGADADVPDADKLFLAAEYVEVYAMTIVSTPQEVIRAPVPDAGSV